MLQVVQLHNTEGLIHMNYNVTLWKTPPVCIWLFPCCDHYDNKPGEASRESRREGHHVNVLCMGGWETGLGVVLQLCNMFVRWYEHVYAIDLSCTSNTTTKSTNLLILIIGTTDFCLTMSVYSMCMIVVWVKWIFQPKNYNSVIVYTHAVSNLYNIFR